MESYVKFPLGVGTLETLTSNAKDYALAHGISMRGRDLPSDTIVPLSFTLLPSPFPLYWFEYAKSIQSEINMVMHNVAYDDDFLKESLKNTVAVDEFTAKLFNIHEKIIKEREEESFSLGLFRSDYLLNRKDNKESMGLKQVEVNAIASSFGGLAPQLYELHRYILSELKIKITEKMLPVNPARNELAKGLYIAWETYGNPNAVILFLVEETTYNISDQRLLEFCISENYNHKITIIRCRFSDLQKTIALQNGRLFMQNKEIAVVYYRTGYDPSQYSSEDWEIRLIIEKSKAIKCPSVRYHLAGTKKIQQELSRPGVLEKYLSNKSNAEKIREIFANQYSLELNSEGDRAVALALDTPGNFVMKPQREGGGNNIYGSNIKKELEKIASNKEREGYILMECIKPPPVKNYIVKANKEAKLCNMVSELGIFGVILGNKDNIIQNYEAGHLLRSKQTESNEGGIAAGFGALDSPYLI